MKLFQKLIKKATDRLPEPNQRSQSRIPSRYYGYLHAVTGALLSDCLVKDISETGARLILPKAANLPKQILLRVTGEVTPISASVVWQTGTKCGLEFHEGSPPLICRTGL